MASDTSGSLQVRSHTDVAALDEFEMILRTGEVPEEEVVDDPDAISREIIAAILAAEDEESMFAAVGSGAVGWRELKGVPVEVRGFRWRRSAFDEGGPVFVVVSAINVETGEVLALTTGASNVLAQLLWAARHDLLPGWMVTLQEADKATTAGYRPLKLVPASS